MIQLFNETSSKHRGRLLIKEMALYSKNRSCYLGAKLMINWFSSSLQKLMISSQSCVIKWTPSAPVNKFLEFCYCSFVCHKEINYLVQACLSNSFCNLPFPLKSNHLLQCKTLLTLIEELKETKSNSFRLTLHTKISVLNDFNR